MHISTAIAKVHHEMYGEKIYEEVRRIGFTAIDYNMPFYDADLPNMEIYNTNAAEFDTFFTQERRRIETDGLVVGQTHAPYHVYHKDKQLFACRIEEIRYAIRATAILGAEYVVIHPAQPCHFDPDTNPARTRDINYGMLEQLIPMAQEYGIRLALENMPGDGVPTSTPEMLVDYIDMMHSDSLVACLDTGHANLVGGYETTVGENIADFARQLGQRVKTLHLHDNCGRLDEHYIPFLGTIPNWVEFMQELKKIGYTGNINLEADTFLNRLPMSQRKKALEISYGVAQILKNLYTGRQGILS